MYDPGSGQRLLTDQGESRLDLTTIEVLAATPTPPPTSLPPCQVTIPNGQTPPNEQPAAEHHGSDPLWTRLAVDGKITFKANGPGQIFPDGSLGMKWWWWRGEGELTVAGRRLDASAPPLQVDIPEVNDSSSFLGVAMHFPTEGCWQITGRVGQAELTVVTLVIIDQQP